MFEVAEQNVSHLVQWLKLIVESLGVSVVFLGVALAALKLARAALRGWTADFNPVRLQLARYLALGLEFQLGADILSTAVAPTWQQIGQLGAIAVIRTLLNFFLVHEINVNQKIDENRING